MGVRLVYRGSGQLRVLLIAFLAAVACVASAALILMILPAPHTRIHYLLAGTSPAVAGMVALLARTERERRQTRRCVVRRMGPAA